MTNEDFNKKYKNWLADRFYGLRLNNEKAINYLDTKFQEFIKRPDFKYYQIKMKFNSANFYTEGVTRDEIIEIENHITSLYK